MANSGSQGRRRKRKWLSVIKPRVVLRVPIAKLAHKTALWLNVTVPGSLKYIKAGFFVKTDLRKSGSSKKNAGSRNTNRRARLEGKGASSSKK